MQVQIYLFTFLSSLSGLIEATTHGNPGLLTDALTHDTAMRFPETSSGTHIPSPISATLTSSEATGPGSSTNSPSPVQICYGISDDRYVTRNTLNDIIENQFCLDAVKSRSLYKAKDSIVWGYNDGTPEKVTIGIDWKDAPDFQPTFQDCIKFLRDMVLDGCDGNDPENPMNWKGGGSVETNGVKYHIKPVSPRQPAPKKPHGGCTVKSYDHYHHILIWGAGWESSDSGENLGHNLQDCSPLPDTFHFKYGLGPGGREWNATVYTPTSQSDCVNGAAKKAGAPDGFACSKN